MSYIAPTLQQVVNRLLEINNMRVSPRLSESERMDIFIHKFCQKTRQPLNDKELIAVKELLLMPYAKMPTHPMKLRSHQ